MKRKAILIAALSTFILSTGMLVACEGETTAKTDYAVKVHFDLNCETTDTAPASIQCTTGTAYGALPQVTAENEGYNFAGWNTRADGNGMDVSEETLVNYTSGEHTLYAVWEGKDYSLSFDLGGGEINGVTEIADRTITYDEPYGSLAIPSDPEKWMEVFKGWYLNPEGEGRQIDMSTMVTTPGDHTLYAVFRPIRLEYNFESSDEIEDFYSLGGNVNYYIVEGEEGNYLEITNTSANPTTQLILPMQLTAGTTIEFDVEFIGEASAEDGVKAGFFFYGANQDGTTFASHKLGVPGAAGTPDHVNKWYWGQGARNDPWEAAVWNDGHIQYTVNVLEDCYGLHMYLEFGYVQLKDDFGNVIGHKEDKSLWENNIWRINSIKINYIEPPRPLENGTEVTIDFDLNYQTDLENPASISGIVGKAIGELPVLAEREGCAFVGWNTEPDGTGKEYDDSKKITSTSERFTLYAIWEGYVYNVDYQLNGGETLDGETSIIDAMVTYDKPYGSDLLPKLTKEGYTFGGWALDEEGSQVVTEKTAVSILGDHTLYAIFLEDVNNVNVFDFSDPKQAMYFSTQTALSFGYVSDENGGYLEVLPTGSPKAYLLLMKDLKAGSKVEVDVEFVGEVDYDDGVKAGAFFYGAKEDGNTCDSHALGVPGETGTSEEVTKWYWGQGARNDPWEAAVWNDGHIQFTVNILEDCAGISIYFEFGRKTDATGAEVLDSALWENNSWRVNSLTFTLAGQEVDVDFNLNGGTAEGSATVEGKTLITGKPYGELPTPQKENCEFVGWYLTEDFTGEAITADTIVEISEAHTLYAAYSLIRNSYDFTTQDQLLDFYTINNDATIEIVTDETGSYLKIMANGTNGNYAYVSLRNIFLAAGSTVEFDVEFVGSAGPTKNTGFLTYGEDENYENISTSGQGYHNKSDEWNNGTFTVTTEITEDCYGVNMKMQLGADTANGYWKITAIRINRA